MTCSIDTSGIDSMKMNSEPTYRIDLSYNENYHRGPFFDGAFPERSLRHPASFLGFKVNSRLGVPAGPLLNANWVTAYARLGFDLLVYKTVRTCARSSHPAPNCLVLDIKEAITEKDIGGRLVALQKSEAPQLTQMSITNSFGMPSQAPEIWQTDVAKAKAGLKQGQILIVSVVGTPGQRPRLADDYADAAAMALEAGAQIIEINLSCPNVVGREGALFSDPDASSEVSSRVKKRIGSIPLLIKIGYIPDIQGLQQVVAANAPHVQGIASVNTLSFEIVNPDASPALPGKGRLTSGVCGSAIKPCAMNQAARLVQLRQKEGYEFVVVGVGGAMTAEDIQDYFNLGVDAVMSATGAMWDPYLAYRYWKLLEESENTGKKA